MLTYRWLGAAGLELCLDGCTLLIDPFFTRPSKLALLSGARVRSDPRLTAQYAPRADAVLVTHPHYDHLMDVPDILERTGAQAFGSLNTCALLAWHGIPNQQLQRVRAGDCFEVGPFSIQVYPATHTRLPFNRWIDGALPQTMLDCYGGALQRPAPNLPLSLWQYRMDTCTSFHIRAENHTLLVGNHPVRADLVFLSPYQPELLLTRFLSAAVPRIVVPIHWDDFTRPLSLPIQPMLITRVQGLRKRFAVVGPLDLNAFEAQVKAVLPGAQVQIPSLFQAVQPLFAE